jgi:tetrahydromethanopterin S-methyltransferase subunit H
MYNCNDNMDIRIIIKIHLLIQAELTGNPCQFSIKLGLSERSIHYYISYMKKEMNAPIMFNTQKGSYCYNRNCEFNFKG